MLFKKTDMVKEIWLVTWKSQICTVVSWISIAYIVFRYCYRVPIEHVKGVTVHRMLSMHEARCAHTGSFLVLQVYDQSHFLLLIGWENPLSSCARSPQIIDQKIWNWSNCQKFTGMDVMCLNKIDPSCYPWKPPVCGASSLFHRCSRILRYL